MSVRKPIVAGQFYPADHDSCLKQILDCVQAIPQPQALPESVVGGIVPHAGWVFSGSLAASVFSCVHRVRPETETFVICGAAHRYMGDRAAMDDSEAWETPLGPVLVDDELRRSLSNCSEVTIDSAAHHREHSIEVQVPFIKHLFPEARIVPVVVSPTEAAISFGKVLADEVSRNRPNVAVIGSTDLTHYGPSYGFTPMGLGSDALKWAREVNDREFVDLALAIEPERLLTSAVNKGNACGPGAAAVPVAVARKWGVQAGLLLGQTTSSDVMAGRGAAAGSDSVGYAAILF